MKTAIRTALIVLPVLFAQSSTAQDYRLPPSMKGSPAAPSKPDVDYRVPSTPSGREKPAEKSAGASVKIRNLDCVVQDYTYGIATGSVENLSKETISHIEVTVAWNDGRRFGGGMPFRPVAVRPLPLGPGATASFRAEGRVAGTARGCNATVSAR